MPRTKKRRKPTRIEESGISVRLFQRGDQWWADLRLESGRRRLRLNTTLRSTAESNARALARSIATSNLTGVRPDTLTLGQLLTAYREHRLDTLSPARRKEADTRITMFLDAWGANLPVSDIDQTRIEAYCAARRSLKIVPPAFRLDAEGKRSRGYRTPQTVRDGALDGEFRFLNAVLNWACGFKQNGRPLLSANPLPKRGSDRRKLGWPVERNPRRPVAAHDRYTRTQEHTDAVDPQGRLRCILTLARHTGRRESAICALHASDLLLSPDRIRAALADASLNEADAEHMQHGAILWRAANDKQGYLFVTPINQHTRIELELYLRRSARVGDVVLFPAPGPKLKKGATPRPKAEQSISRDLAAKWVVAAERRADLPKLRGGVFHPYRRLWAIERQHEPAVEVAAAGGWADTQALTRIYQRATARGVAAAVNAVGVMLLLLLASCTQSPPPINVPVSQDYGYDEPSIAYGIGFHAYEREYERVQNQSARHAAANAEAVPRCVAKYGAASADELRACHAGVLDARWVLERLDPYK
jgi:integrase